MVPNGYTIFRSRQNLSKRKKIMSIKRPICASEGLDAEASFGQLLSEYL